MYKKSWKQTCPVCLCKVGAFFQVCTYSCNFEGFMGFYKLVKAVFFPPLLNKPRSASHCSLSPWSFDLFCRFCLLNLSFSSCSTTKASQSRFSFPSWALSELHGAAKMLSPLLPSPVSFFFFPQNAASTNVHSAMNKQVKQLKSLSCWYWRNTRIMTGPGMPDIV